MISKKTLLFIALSTFVSQAHAQTSVRLERLNLMFEGNLSGAIYAMNCAPQPLSAYPGYIENARLTSQSLSAELLKLDKTLTPQKVAQSLSERQSQIITSISTFYKQNGCNTSQAQSAKKHFDMFSQKPSQEMRDFLGNIESR